MAAISTTLTQLASEAGKNALVIARSPAITIIQIAFPLAMFGIIMSYRKTIHPTLQHSCSLAPRSLPQEGSIAHIQSFLCNINQTCYKNDSDVPARETNAQERFSSIQRLFSPFLHNDTKRKSIEDLPRSMKVLKSITQAIRGTTDVRYLGSEITVGAFFQNRTSVIQLLTIKFKLFHVDIVNDFLDGKFDLRQFLNGKKYESIHEIICDPTYLQSVIKFSSNRTSREISSVLCKLAPSARMDITRALLKLLNPGEIIRLFSDYAKLIGDNSLASYSDRIAQLVDLIMQFNITKYYDEALYHMISKWFGAQINKSLKTFDVESLSKTIKEISSLGKIVAPFLNYFNADISNVWSLLQNGVEEIVSLLHLIKSAESSTDRVEIKFQTMFEDHDKVLRYIETNLRESKGLWTLVFSGSMQYEGISHMIQNWLNGKSFKHILCQSPRLMSLLCIKSPRTPKCLDYSIIQQSQSMLCASDSDNVDKVVTFMASNINMTKFQSRLQLATKPSLSHSEWLKVITSFQNTTKYEKLFQSIEKIFEMSDGFQPALRILAKMFDQENITFTEFVAGMGSAIDTLQYSGLINNTDLTVFHASKSFARGLALGFVRVEEFLKFFKSTLQDKDGIIQRFIDIISKTGTSSNSVRLYTTSLFMHLMGTNFTKSDYKKYCDLLPRNVSEALCHRDFERKLHSMKSQFKMKIMRSYLSVFESTYSFVTNKTDATSWTAVVKVLGDGPMKIEKQLFDVFKTLKTVIETSKAEELLATIKTVIYQTLVNDAATVLFQYLDSLKEAPKFWQQIKPVILSYHKYSTVIKDIVFVMKARLRKDYQILSVFRNDPNLQITLSELIQNLPILLHHLNNAKREHEKVYRMLSAPGFCKNYTLIDILANVKSDRKTLSQWSDGFCQILQKFNASGETWRSEIIPIIRRLNETFPREIPSWRVVINDFTTFLNTVSDIKEMITEQLLKHLQMLIKTNTSLDQNINGSDLLRIEVLAQTIVNIINVEHHEKREWQIFKHYVNFIQNILKYTNSQLQLSDNSTRPEILSKKFANLQILVDSALEAVPDLLIKTPSNVISTVRTNIFLRNETDIYCGNSSLTDKLPMILRTAKIKAFVNAVCNLLPSIEEKKTLLSIASMAIPRQSHLLNSTINLSSLLGNVKLFVSKTRIVTSKITEMLSSYFRFGNPSLNRKFGLLIEKWNTTIQDKTFLSKIIEMVIHTIPNASVENYLRRYNQTIKNFEMILNKSLAMNKFANISNSSNAVRIIEMFRRYPNLLNQILHAGIHFIHNPEKIQLFSMPLKNICDKSTTFEAMFAVNISSFEGQKLQTLICSLIKMDGTTFVSDLLNLIPNGSRIIKSIFSNMTSALSTKNTSNLPKSLSSHLDIWKHFLEDIRNIQAKLNVSMFNKTLFMKALSPSLQQLKALAPERSIISSINKYEKLLVPFLKTIAVNSTFDRLKISMETVTRLLLGGPNNLLRELNKTKDGWKLLTLANHFKPFLQALKKTIILAPYKFQNLASQLNLANKSVFDFLCNDVNVSDFLMLSVEYNQSQAATFMSTLCSIDVRLIIPESFQTLASTIFTTNNPHPVKTDVVKSLANVTALLPQINEILNGKSLMTRKYREMLTTLNLHDLWTFNGTINGILTGVDAYLLIIRSTSSWEPLTKTVDILLNITRLINKDMMTLTKKQVTINDLFGGNSNFLSLVNASGIHFRNLSDISLNITKLREWLKINDIDQTICKYGFTALLNIKSTSDKSLDRALCKDSNPEMKEEIKKLFDFATLTDRLTRQILSGPLAYLKLRNNIIALQALFGLNNTLQHSLIDNLMKLANRSLIFNETHLIEAMITSPKWWTAFTDLIIGILNVSIPMKNNELAFFLSIYSSAMETDTFNYSLLIPTPTLLNQFMESLKTMMLVPEIELFIKSPSQYMALLRQTNPVSVLCNREHFRSHFPGITLSSNHHGAVCLAAVRKKLVILNLLQHYGFGNINTTDGSDMLKRFLSWTINFAMHHRQALSDIEKMSKPFTTNLLDQIASLGKTGSSPNPDFRIMYNTVCGIVQSVHNSIWIPSNESRNVISKSISTYRDLAINISKVLKDFPRVLCSLSEKRPDPLIQMINRAFSVRQSVQEMVPTFGKTIGSSCPSLIATANNVTQNLREGSVAISRDLEGARHCFKEFLSLFSNSFKEIHNLKSHVSKLDTLSKAIPEGLSTLLKIVPESLKTGKRVKVKYQKLVNDRKMLDYLASLVSVSPAELAKSEILIDVQTLSKMSDAEMQAALCNQSTIKKYFVFPNSTNITADDFLRIICLSSKSNAFENIVKIVSLGKLSLLISLEKDVAMEPVFEFFSSMMDLYNELQNYGQLTSLFKQFEFHNISSFVTKLEYFIFAISQNTIWSKTMEVFKNVVSLSSFSIYNRYFTTLEITVNGLNGISNVRRYFPLKFHFLDFFDNRTQIYELLQKNGVAVSEADQLLNSNFTLLQLEFLIRNKYIPVILCNRSSIYILRSSKLFHDGMPLDICKNLSNEELKNAIVAIGKRLSFMNYFKSKLIKGFEETLKRDGTSIKDAMNTLKDFSTMDDLVKSLSSGIEGETSNQAYNKYRNDSRNSSSTAALGMAMCGSTSPVGFPSEFSLPTIASTKRRKRRSVDQKPMNFCYDLLTSAGKSTIGKLFARFLQPLMYGKILVTPDVPWVRKIMEKANNTYKEMAALRIVTSSLSKTLDNYKSSYGSNLLSDLRKVIKKSILTTLIPDHIGVSEVENAVKKLETLVVSNQVDKLQFYLEIIKNLTSCTEMDRIQFFKDEKDPNYKDQLFKHNDLYVYAAINFIEINNDYLKNSTKAPKHISYKIRMPNSLSHPTNLLYWGAYPKVRSHFLHDLKYSQGFVQLQESIDKAIIEEQTGRSSASQPFVKTRQFPKPCKKMNNFMMTIGQHVMPFMILLSWLPVLLTSVADALVERENNLERPLYVMGRNSFARWSAWFCQNMTICMILTFIITLCLKYGDLLPDVDGSIILISLTLFSLCTLMFGYFISSLFNRSSLALLVTIIAYLVSYVPFAMGSGTGIAISQIIFKLSMITPIIPMSYLCQYWGSYQANSIPFTWAEMPHQLLDVSPTACLMVLLIDSAIYMIMGWYIRNVFAGRGGISLPFFFFLTKRYWGIDDDTKSLYTLAARSSDPTRKDHPFNIYDKGDDKTSKSSVSSIESLHVAVQIRNLSKQYKSAEKLSVSDLNIDLRQNEVTVLLGPNGAGKSTAISMILGLVKPTSGTITIGGLDREKNYHALRRKIGFCPQNNIFFPSLSVQNNLNYFASINNTYTATERKNVVHDILVHLDLLGLAKSPASKLSGGQKRRLSVGIAFVGNSDLVVLDEPTSGVDPAARRAIWNLISAYKVTRTVLLCTHHIDEAEIIGDRVAILRDSQLIAYDTPRALREKFGCRYDIALILNDDMFEQKEEVIEKVRDNIPEADIKTQNETIDICLRANVSTTEKLETLFRNLEFCSLKGILKNIGVTFISLENVFLRLIQSTTTDIEKQIDENDPKSHEDLHDLYETIDTNMKEKEIKIVEDNSKDDCKMEYITEEEKADDILDRVGALLYKHSLHTLRNWITYVAQILIPCFFLILTLAGAKLVPNYLDYPPLLLTPTTMGEKTISFLKIPPSVNGLPILSNLKNGSGIGTICMDNPGLLRFPLTCLEESKMIFKTNISQVEKEKFLSAPQCICKSQMGQLECPSKYSRNNPPNILQLRSSDRILIIQPNDESVSRFLKYEVSKFTTHQSIIWGGWEFGSSNQSVTVWYNTQSFHTLPSYFNALSNMVLRGYKMLETNSTTKAFNFGISTYVHPLPNSEAMYKYDDLNKKITNIGFSIGILVCITMISCSLALRTLRENLCNEKFLQQLYGVSPHLYWTINFLWDIGSSLVSIALLSIIFASIRVDLFVDRLNLPATILLIFLYIFASVPLCYLIGRGTKSIGRGFLVTFLPLIFSGFVFPMIVTMNDLMNQGKTGGISRYIESISMVIPSVSFTFGLGKLAKNQMIAEVKMKAGMDAYSNPFGYDMLLPNFIYLCVQGVVFFALNCILEIQSVKKLYHKMHLRSWLSWKRQKRNSSKYSVSSTSISSIEDDCVQEERIRVQKSNPESQLLLISNLSKNYFLSNKKIAAVTDVTFGIPKGECFGLLGANGAGKTSVFKCITGELSASHGSVQILNNNVGLDVHNLGGHVGYCPQTDPLDPYLTVNETIMMYARLRGVVEPNRSRQTKRLQQSLDIEKYRDVKVKHLSGGNRRKLSLAVALVGQPNILLLDEPSSGVDPASKRRIWRLLSTLRQRMAILLTSHSMEEIQKISTRLAVMVNGKLRAIGTCSELKSRYGLSYSLQAWIKNGKAHKVTRLILSNFNRSRLKSRKGNLSEFKIPIESATLSKIFEFLNRLKIERDVEEFAVQDTTLEHVFLEMTAAQSEDLIEECDDDTSTSSGVYDSISFRSHSVSINDNGSTSQYDSTC